MKYRRFLFQGDSITDGGRGRTEDPNHIMGHSYAFSIASRFMADFPELELEFFNRACSGDSHVEMEKRWQTDTLDLNPDVLSILIGTNGSRQACGIYMPWDEGHPEGPDPLQTPEVFENSLRRMLTAARKQNPDLLIVLCVPFRYTGCVKTPERTQEILRMVDIRAEIIRRLAVEFHAVIADFKTALEQSIALNGKRPYWSWDGVHVTVAGYEILAREWVRAVKPHIDFLKNYNFSGEK